MAKFKVGDRVRRKRSSHMEMAVGDEATVTKSTTYLHVELDKFVGHHDETALELVNEGPIRTVTRREIVPGVYGRLEVCVPYLDSCMSVLLVDRGGNRHDQINYLDATELREAAHLFNQLAEVLEEDEGVSA